MSDLLLTLGHNASAIAISIDNDGMATVQNAYELERLTSVKSDSRFPLDAMIALKDRGVETFDRVYVTHWAPTNRVNDLKLKYWDRSVFPPEVQVFTQESQSMTHHDCHAAAAIAFAGPEFPVRDTGVLVIDGFGSFAEHLSYYRLDETDGHAVLANRVHGYYTSLGLMYQYATAFLGMKMHEDEYKLLGYGAQVNGVGVDRVLLDDIAMNMVKVILKEMRSPNMNRLDTSLETLPDVQEMWAKRWLVVLNSCGMQGIDVTSHEARCIVGYTVQTILELVVMNLFASDLGRPANLIMTGGCALNVELNRVLLSIVPGKLCVMPLAGDQGNSIGLWARHNRRARLEFGDLCWGVRSIPPTEPEGLPEGLHVFERDGDDVYALIRGELESTGFVNVVRGRMEFGPRALCNTTTLARANDPAVVDEINRINGRDSVMPFAPVLMSEHLVATFPDAARLHKSERFMICALKYDERTGGLFPGAALHTARGHVTGRPQSYVAKYEGDSVARVLTDVGLLINTSFNVHGVPICCDLKDVVHSHQYQRERNPNVRTIVIKE